jgi:hypothetical protein
LHAALTKLVGVGQEGRLILTIIRELLYFLQSAWVGLTNETRSQFFIVVSRV